MDDLYVQVAAVDTKTMINNFCRLSKMLYGASGVASAGNCSVVAEAVTLRVASAGAGCPGCCSCAGCVLRDLLSSDIVYCFDDSD